VRVLLTLASMSLLGACSFLDQLEVNGPPGLDPSRIYLGTSRVSVSRLADLDRYACVGTPLVCEQAGTGFQCRCTP
jgi:hypothetical protein